MSLCALAMVAGLATTTSPWTAPAIARGTDQPADPYEGRVVTAVDLAPPEGADDLTQATLTTARNNLRTYAGGAYRRETIDEDIRRLNRLGLFSRVEAHAQLLADGSVRLVFELTERAVIRDVQVTGNTKINDRELADQVDLLVGAPVDRFQVDRAARRIEQLYRDKGYYLVRVTVDEPTLAETGVVLYRVREGERLKITAIRFEGVRGVSERLIRRELETKVAGIFRKGPLDEDLLDADIANIITFYRDRGFLDIRADRIVTPAPNGREAIITYLVEEGPRYTLRSVKSQTTTADRNSAPVFSPEQLAGLIGIKPGDDYGVRDLDDAVERVADAYGQLGYADVRVNRLEQRDPTRPVVDLLLIISEGRAFRTGEIVIQGNSITMKNVPLRELEIRPDRPLDTTAIEASRVQLQRLRLFNSRETRITIQPPDPIDPLYRDVLVEIKETNTGEFNVGGAVSSDSGVVGRIALIQRNFDLFDTPDSAGDFFSGRAFRGAGQTFSLEALPGDRVQTFSLGLSDPALWDSDYSGNATVFYRNRDFDEFDERRWGSRFGFGRRFGTRWNGSLNFRVESIDLSDLEPDRPTDIFAVADENWLTTASISLVRTTLDTIIRPTEGSRTELAVEQAGALGGDFYYTKLSAEHRTYIALREDLLGRATVLSFNLRAGYVPQGPSEIPTYERFYLGGQQFRGFDFRTVSPKGIRNDNGQPSDDPVGGTWLFFAGAELNQPIFEELFSGVIFLDTGTVTNDPGFEDYRVSAGFGIRIVVPALSPAPLAFDFGWPILSEDDDESRVFSFSLDVPF